MDAAAGRSITRSSPLIDLAFEVRRRASSSAQSSASLRQYLRGIAHRLRWMVAVASIVVDAPHLSRQRSAGERLLAMSAWSRDDVRGPAALRVIGDLPRATETAMLPLISFAGSTDEKRRATHFAGSPALPDRDEAKQRRRTPALPLRRYRS